jgi:hypothetical protein
VLLARLLGMKFKLIEGYSGPAAVVLAMDRGEVDGICQTVTSLANYRPGPLEAGQPKTGHPTDARRGQGSELRSYVMPFVERGASIRPCADYVSCWIDYWRRPHVRRRRGRCCCRGDHHS